MSLKHWSVGSLLVFVLVAVDMLVRRSQLHCPNRVPDLQVQVKLREEASSWAGLGVSQDLSCSRQSAAVVQEEAAFALDGTPEVE
jgi:hypothetical protein